MKIYVFVPLIVTAGAFALSIEDEDELLESLLANEGESLQLAPVEEHHRERRVVCDLLSGFGVNHSVCAAYCIYRGFKGGYCTETGTCECRME